MNLFWSTRALTYSREDHLTEFFASALTISPSFRKSYFDLVLKDFVTGKGWIDSPIVDIQTQIGFEGTTCCPDMILRLSNGKSIACEHKLDALETIGPERDQRAQLIRYLDLPIDGLLYVRTAWRPPDAQVLRHPKYVRPAGREHFLWRDFYPLLVAEKGLFFNWIREGFERLGFTPPHPSIGEMSGSDEETNRMNRKNFAKLWGPTRSLAHSLGWKVHSDSIVELYLTENISSIAAWVFVSPARFDRFLFRVTPRENSQERIYSLLLAATSNMPERTEVVVHPIPRKEGKTAVIDFITSLREILGDKPLNNDIIETKLVNFIEPLLRSLQAGQ